jgi:hypothetical protein
MSTQDSFYKNACPFEILVQRIKENPSLSGITGIEGRFMARFGAKNSVRTAVISLARWSGAVLD